MHLYLSCKRSEFSKVSSRSHNTYKKYYIRFVKLLFKQNPTQSSATKLNLRITSGPCYMQEIRTPKISSHITKSYIKRARVTVN